MKWIQSEQWPRVAAETLDKQHDLWQQMAEAKGGIIGGKSPGGISGGGRVQGIVRWFSSQLGYGFINQDGTDVYVHHSQIIMEGYRTLREGQVVEYTPVDAERGPAAHRVVVR